jgi:hypothetical protein
MKPHPQRHAANNGTAKTGAFSFTAPAPYSDKTELVEKKLTFTILSIEYQQGRGFEGKDRWAVTVAPDDGRGSEVVTLDCNEKRDAELRSAQSAIKRDGPIRSVRLKRSGKAFYFESPAGVKA